MRTRIFVAFFLTGLLVVGVTAANAADITWTLLLHSSVAGAGPGADALMGTTDDTSTGEKNTCNYSQDKACAGASAPATGTYSFAALEYAEGVDNACGLGDLSGQACVCADETACNEDDDCEATGCGAAKCCPGSPLGCVQCEDQPAFDSYSYFGDGLAAGTMVLTQSGTSTTVASFDVGTSPSVDGLGGGCIELHEDGGSYPSCGVGGFTGGVMNVTTYTGGCPLLPNLKADIKNIAFDGGIIDLDNLPGTNNCGYSSDDISAIAAAALDASGGDADYLLILCGETPLPADETTPCLRNGHATFRNVAWTAADATDCGP